MMKTYKLWLEQDKDIPRFKRLNFKKVDAPLADVLNKGIHPLLAEGGRHYVGEKVVAALNESELMPIELAQCGYCSDVSEIAYNVYGQNDHDSLLDQTLRRIRQALYFAGALSYVELLAIAKQRLRDIWSHSVAHSLLERTFQDFDGMRSFLKAKSHGRQGPAVKLSGYADIANYDLGEILTPEDFTDEDSIIIAAAVPITNFRSTTFIDNVTDEEGRLRLVDSIPHFRVTVRSGGGHDGLSSGYAVPVAYNCRVSGDNVRLIPVLDQCAKRTLARAVAEKFRTDNGRYCFTTDIARVDQLLSERSTELSFPSLSYTVNLSPPTASAKIHEAAAEQFRICLPLTARASVQSIKQVLRRHDISMTGRKEQLLAKLATLAAQLYEEHVVELDAYFNNRRYIRIRNAINTGANRTPFPLPPLEGLELGHMILSMYAIRHLRGNAILEATHENDTYDTLSLARALIRREVTFDGAFMRVV
ncbi:hypothetical protein ACFL34_02830 [Candidatus Sumerlaeota bacterium]